MRPASSLKGILQQLLSKARTQQGSPVRSHLQLSQTCSPGLAHCPSLQMPSEYLLCARRMLGMGTLRCHWLTRGQEETQLAGRMRLRSQQGGDGQLQSPGQKAFTKGGLEK